MFTRLGESVPGCALIAFIIIIIIIIISSSIAILIIIIASIILIIIIIIIIKIGIIQNIDILCDYVVILWEFVCIDSFRYKLRDMIAEVDTDNSKTIEFSEFLEMMKKGVYVYVCMCACLSSV